MKIGCVIITYNIGEEIVNTFNSIYNQVDKIVFVDNNSSSNTKNTLNEISEKYDNCEVIFNKVNEGIAKALNIGIRKLSVENYDFILTLDHDSIAPNNMIENMLNIYEKIKNKEKIGILCPAIYDINKKDYLTKVNKSEYQIIKEPIQSGALISKNVINDIGYFNEQLYIYYVDTEFVYRSNLKGYKNIQCNKVVLSHEEGKKTQMYILGKKIYYQNYSEFALYYRARNYVYMIKKYKKYFTSRDRIIKDAIKIILFDRNKINAIKAHIKGFYDGINMEWDNI